MQSRDVARPHRSRFSGLLTNNGRFPEICNLQLSKMCRLRFREIIQKRGGKMLNRTNWSFNVLNTWFQGQSVSRKNASDLTFRAPLSAIERLNDSFFAAPFSVFCGSPTKLNDVHGMRQNSKSGGKMPNRTYLGVICPITCFQGLFEAKT